MPYDAVTARQRVMIISHEMRSGLELADSLASDGYEVAIARQADEAAEQLAGRQPDRIVLDHHLPIAHGLEALRLIKLQCPHVPVFTITGVTASLSGLPRGSAGGASLFFTPLQGSVLGALLDAQLRT